MSIQRLTQCVILQQLDEADVFLDHLLPQSQGRAHVLQDLLAGIRQLLPKVVRVKRHSLELPGHHLGKHTNVVRRLQYYCRMVVNAGLVSMSCPYLIPILPYQILHSARSIAVVVNQQASKHTSPSYSCAALRITWAVGGGMLSLVMPGILFPLPLPRLRREDFMDLELLGPKDFLGSNTSSRSLFADLFLFKSPAPSAGLHHPSTHQFRDKAIPYSPYLFTVNY